MGVAAELKGCGVLAGGTACPEAAPTGPPSLHTNSRDGAWAVEGADATPWIRLFWFHTRLWAPLAVSPTNMRLLFPSGRKGGNRSTQLRQEAWVRFPVLHGLLSFTRCDPQAQSRGQRSPHAL